MSANKRNRTAPDPVGGVYGAGGVVIPVNMIDSGAALPGNIFLNTQNHYNVANFGAACDGVTDDTAAIQACFNAAAQSNVNVTIYIPGFCVTSATLTYTLNGKNGVAFSGLSRQSCGFLCTNVNVDILSIVFNIPYANLDRLNLAYDINNLWFKHVTGGNALSTGFAYPPFSAANDISGSSNVALMNIWFSSTCAIRISYTGTAPNIRAVPYGASYRNLMFTGSYIGILHDCVTSVSMDNCLFEGSGLQYRGSYNYGLNSCAMCFASNAALGEGDPCFSNLYAEGYTVPYLFLSGGGIKMTNTKANYSAGPPILFDQQNFTNFGYGQTTIANCGFDNGGGIGFIVFMNYLENGSGDFYLSNIWVGNGTIYICGKNSASTGSGAQQGNFIISNSRIGGIRTGRSTDSLTNWSTSVPSNLSGMVVSNNIWDGDLVNLDSTVQNVVVAGNRSNTYKNSGGPWFIGVCDSTNANISYDFVNSKDFVPNSVVLTKTTTTLTLTWAVSNYQAAGFTDTVESYNVRLWSNGLSVTNTAVAGGTLTYTTPALTAGTAYTIQVGVVYAKMNIGFSSNDSCKFISVL